MMYEPTHSLGSKFVLSPKLFHAYRWILNIANHCPLFARCQVHRYRIRPLFVTIWSVSPSWELSAIRSANNLNCGRGGSTWTALPTIEPEGSGVWIENRATAEIVS